MAQGLLSDYFNALDVKDRKHYLSKLTLSNGERLPDPYTLTGWTDNIRDLPGITWRDVNDYLINTPSVFTKDPLKAYKSLQAYDYFVCGHVQDCFYSGISEKSEFCFIKSEVSYFNLTCISVLYIVFSINNTVGFEILLHKLCISLDFSAIL